MEENSFTIFVVSAALAVCVVTGLIALFAYNRRLVKNQTSLKNLSISIEEIQKKSDLALSKRFAEADELIAERKLKLAEEEQKNVARSRELAVREEKIAKIEFETSKKSAEISQLRERYEAKILEISGISKEDARAEVLRIEAERASEEARKIRRDILEKSAEEHAFEAKKLLVTTMQRIAPRMNEERSTVLVAIPSESTKGRLIGKEGRNIKCFEQCTGTTLIIDETPGTVLVSCFDPFRRQVAATALKRLIEDGRIHPQSIEEFVKEADEEVRADALQIGTKACDELGVSAVPEKVRELLGHLEFRLSVNQNTLTHSIETAKLAGTFAAELGLDSKIAIRAGLFHDIGKAISADNEDAHAIVGAKILRQAGEREVIVTAV